ncbi:uncharacterized protein N7515_010098 [Penicillium bovifimosum]|uniref:Pinin/SDK/MemA protein domain-containing protein n=1 Tax=Penicillium bovifimosum TaxID=126998 RepID=A0A9W9KVA0_9EURO|nr:uncharacterized protein N7515_010098 [Penicillium bovifimosum]KAJ5120710.1 hypothetical protein N7515_010098 [Penicillium bovifimosum]
MSDGPETLASAVAVPDQDTEPQSPELTAKRRQSSIAEYDAKRRRLSSQGDISPQSQRGRPSSPGAIANEPAGPRPVRPRGAGREEDRKRGQRLFGGLLGTLSQSSSTAAQRRRADIEKKQQEKLKTQDVQYDELRKRRKELREEVRRREKPLYEREAMQTRHSNMLAIAHFLKTRTEPVLYYKPWQSRPGDESIIQQQIEEAKATIAREVAEFEARYPPEAFAPEQPTLAEPQQQPNEEKTQEPKADTQSDGQQVPPPAPEPEVTPTDTGSKETAEGAPDTVGVDANDQKPIPPTTDETTNVEEVATQDQTDPHRDDDGGEVLEDNEDTVIY